MSSFRSVIPLLRVADSRRTQSLFELLAFRSLWEHQESPEAPRFMEMHRDGVSVFLSEHGGDGPFGVQVYFVVDDADALFQSVQGRDIRCSAEPHDAAWGHRVFELEDFDGNTLRFGSPIEGD
ncbi:MAG: glyoxalase superfamily protein [Phycisphaerae bacterium]|nr:glyoxalase superfamily protein [Phycisphaerae bacterium]